LAYQLWGLCPNPGGEGRALWAQTTGTPAGTEGGPGARGGSSSNRRTSGDTRGHTLPTPARSRAWARGGPDWWPPVWPQRSAAQVLRGGPASGIDRHIPRLSLGGWSRLGIGVHTLFRPPPWPLTSIFHYHEPGADGRGPARREGSPGECHHDVEEEKGSIPESPGNGRHVYAS